MNLKLTLTPYIKNEFKLDHKFKCKQTNKTIKHWEDNIRENLWDLGLGEEFFKITLKTQSIKEQSHNLVFIKIF